MEKSKESKKVWKSMEKWKESKKYGKVDPNILLSILYKHLTILLY